MKLRSGRNKVQVGLLLLPGVAIFAIFTIYPIVKLFLMSFLKWDYSSMLTHEFIGLENYKAVLSDKTFQISFANTIIYTLVTVPGQMILGLLVAALINAIPRFRVTFRHLLYSGYYLLGDCFAGIPLHFQHRGYAELSSDQCAASDRQIYCMAGYPLGRTQRLHDARHLERRGLEYGCVSCCAAKRTAGALRIRCDRWLRKREKILQNHPSEH